VTEPASLLEEIRFGYGPRLGWPLAPGGVDPDRVLAQLTAPDPAGDAWTTVDLATRQATLAEGKRRRQGKPPQGTVLDLRIVTRRDQTGFIARPAAASLGFVERLVNLWANRLTVSAVGGPVLFIPPYRDRTIRPHIAGRFADMLRASLWHPAMLSYLSQNSSIGPNSSFGLRKGRGLNENLAREFLELHSMGAGYDQSDVTELARLLAGMKSDGAAQEMDARAVEPGDKTILHARYGEGVAEIDRFIETVATRPETARSVGLMLARHFLADDPPADLVEDLTRIYLRNDGHLPPLYRALLSHLAAQNPTLVKLRSPQEYMAATLRAVGLTGDPEMTPAFRKTGTRLPEVIARMGQPIFAARRPDGWPERAQGWLTPPMLASRLDWAADLARLTGDRADPGAQARAVLGNLASPLLLSAVAGAEQRWEGLAVLLGSPEMMRR
jgi:uncharacterized protein (DUF1800 family)